MPSLWKENQNRENGIKFLMVISASTISISSDITRKRNVHHSDLRHAIRCLLRTGRLYLLDCSVYPYQVLFLYHLCLIICFHNLAYFQDAINIFFIQPLLGHIPCNAFAWFEIINSNTMM